MHLSGQLTDGTYVGEEKVAGMYTTLTKAKILFVTVIIFGMATALTVPIQAQESGWVQVGTHPQASQQSTAYGKVIRTLEHWNGLLYPGYGDYGANTGPIRITPFDPTTDQFRSTVHTADTEQIHLYRPIGGRLWAPGIDPRKNADYSVGEPWSDHRPVNALHVFDIVSFGGDLWMVGSSGRPARVWRSSDGGASWSLSLSVSPVQSDDYARFYFAGAYGGKLYVQAKDFRSNHPSSKVFDGSNWSDGPDLIGNGHGQSPRTFAGRMVYMYWDPGFCYRLRSFDGSSVSVGHSVYDYVVSSDWLYTLNCQGEVVRTRDYSTWQTVTGALSEARSLAVVGDRIYVGTSDSRIYRHPVTVPSEPPPNGGGGLCILGICIPL